MEKYREDGARVFSEVHRDKMKGNADMLQQRKFWLAIRKNIFTMRVIKYWKTGPEGLGNLHLGGAQSSAEQLP